MRVGGTASHHPERDFWPAARVFTSLRVDPKGSSTSILTVKTRVRLTDADSRRRFKRYWLVVGPISSLIRDTTLRQLTTRLHRAPRDGAAERLRPCDPVRPRTAARARRESFTRRTYRRAAVAVDSRT